MIHAGEKELARHSTHSLKRFIAMDACGANAVECSLGVLSLRARQCVNAGRGRGGGGGGELAMATREALFRAFRPIFRSACPYFFSSRPL